MPQRVVIDNRNNIKIIEVGPRGLAGPKGEPGISGSAAAVGAQGPTGSTGPTGPAGIRGPVGVAGPTGTQGLIGVQGTTGAIGVQGPVGPTGPVGVGSRAASRTVNDAVLTNGSKTVTSASAAFTSADLNCLISAILDLSSDGLPPMNIVEFVDSATQIRVSKEATIQRSVVSVTTNTGSNGISTSGLNSFSYSDVGKSVTGTGIGAGARIASVTDGNDAVLTVNSTANGSITITIGATQTGATVVVGAIFGGLDISSVNGDGGVRLYSTGDLGNGLTRTLNGIGYSLWLDHDVYSSMETNPPFGLPAFGSIPSRGAAAGFQLNGNLRYKEPIGSTGFGLSFQSMLVYSGDSSVVNTVGLFGMHFGLINAQSTVMYTKRASFSRLETDGGPWRAGSTGVWDGASAVAAWGGTLDGTVYERAQQISFESQPFITVGVSMANRTAFRTIPSGLQTERTTVAAGSNATTAASYTGTQTLFLASSLGLKSSGGALRILTNGNTWADFTYAGVSGNNATNVRLVAGSGGFSTGNRVETWLETTTTKVYPTSSNINVTDYNNPSGIQLEGLHVNSTAGFKASGYLSVQTNTGVAKVRYAGILGNTFTGCSIDMIDPTNVFENWQKNDVSMTAGSRIITSATAWATGAVGRIISGTGIADNTTVTSVSGTSLTMSVSALSGGATRTVDIQNSSTGTIYTGYQVSQGGVLLEQIGFHSQPLSSGLENLPFLYGYSPGNYIFKMDEFGTAYFTSMLKVEAPPTMPVKSTIELECGAGVFGDTTSMHFFKDKLDNGSVLSFVTIGGQGQINMGPGGAASTDIQIKRIGTAAALVTGEFTFLDVTNFTWGATMNNQRITNLGNAVISTDAAPYGQVARTIYVKAAEVGTPIGTALTTLGAAGISANSIENGDSLEANVNLQTSTSLNTRTVSVSVSFGGIQIGLFTMSGTSATAINRIVITRVGATNTAAKAKCTFLCSGSAVTTSNLYVDLGVLDWTQGMSLTVSATNSTGGLLNDAILRAFTVRKIIGITPS